MDIAEILKYCPEGTKLYSLIDGEVTLKSVNIAEQYPIETVKDDFRNNYYTKDGLFFSDRPNGECLLFPSKDQRDWNKFRIPIKKGDIMMQIDGTSPFIVTGEMHKDISPMYICGINTLGKLQISFNEGGWTSKFYIPASEEAKKELFDKMAKAGYTWNAKTLKLEKIEPKYRPFRTKEECWNEMLKHQPFGWVKHTSSNEYFYSILEVIDGGCVFVYGPMVPFDEVYEFNTFADGTPFGVKE